MAQALAGGIARDFPDLSFVVSDPSKEAFDAFHDLVAGKAKSADSNRNVFEQSDCVILAVKPQHAAEALDAVDASSQDPLVISIMAGVTISRIHELTQANRVIRVMPNTPLPDW